MKLFKIILYTEVMITIKYSYILNILFFNCSNIENWSIDTLVTLSDFLIVLNQDQLNAIPDMSRLNSSDIILTRYADEIESLSNNVPFYKVERINKHKLKKIYIF